MLVKAVLGAGMFPNRVTVRNDINQKFLVVKFIS